MTICSKIFCWWKLTSFTGNGRYNWLVAFFARHAHRTVYNDEVSSTRSISASIIHTPSQPQTLSRRPGWVRRLARRRTRQHCSVGGQEQLAVEQAQDEGSRLPWQPPASHCPVTAAAAGRRQRHYAESPRRHLQQQLAGLILRMSLELHIVQLPLNSDKFNLCSCACRRFSFTAHRLNAVVHRVRKSTPRDFWR